MQTAALYTPSRASSRSGQLHTESSLHIGYNNTVHICQYMLPVFWLVLYTHYGLTKYVYIKSTAVYVPSSELGQSHPNPSLASDCAPPPRTGGGGAHSPAGEGLGESQFRRLEKKLSILPTLWMDFNLSFLKGRSQTTAASLIFAWNMWKCHMFCNAVYFLAKRYLCIV